MPGRPPSPPPAATFSRRHLLRLAGLGSAGAIALPLLQRAAAGQQPATREALDYTTRAAFDHYDRAWNDGNGNADKTNEAGALGWGEAWLLMGYVEMYRAHNDTSYLDKLVSHFDRVLRSRDSVRGVSDWRGLSLPSWRSMGDYTCGTITLNDAAGRPTLRLRCGVRPANRARVAVSGGSRAGTFKITATFTPSAKKPGEIADTYDNLTMATDSPDFAVRRINDAFTEINGSPAGPRVMLTATDARSDERRTETAPPAPVDGAAFSIMPFIYAVQVGQLLTPIATFVRLVRDTPALARYSAKADEYLDAIEQAVDVHDPEWNENRQTGEGWLDFVKGSPNIFDGADQPHNQYLSLGRVMIHLATLSRDPARREKFRDRATKMARTFKNDLRPTDRGGYRWSYFWSKGVAYRGWSAAENISESQPTIVWPKPGGVQMIEDISHGQLDIDFARMALEHGLGVFDDSDLRRLAATFTRQILTTGKNDVPTTFHNVDGSGAKGSLDNAASGWLVLSAYDPKILPAMRDNYQHRQPPPGPPTILPGIARLNLLSRPSP